MLTTFRHFRIHELSFLKWGKKLIPDQPNYIKLI